MSETPPERDAPFEAGEPLVVDRNKVDTCFGCGADNPDGLQLTFRVQADGAITSRHRVAPHQCGVEEVVHGGIQATILDETMGAAAQASLPSDSTKAPCVTAEMSLRYRRPVPIAEDVFARAEVTRIDGKDIFVEGAIIAPDGEKLTVASSRWRQLPQPG